jgi:hypothetical protein
MKIKNCENLAKTHFEASFVDDFIIERQSHHVIYHLDYHPLHLQARGKNRGAQLQNIPF